MKYKLKYSPDASDKLKDLVTSIPRKVREKKKEHER